MPSRSVGRKGASLDPPIIPVVWLVAVGSPANILTLSNTKACGPRKDVPAVLKTFADM